MTLDDVVKYGIKALKAEAFSREYKENHALNPTLEVAKWEGLDRVDPDVYADLQRTSPDFAPARHKSTLDNYIGANFSRVVGAVEGVGASDCIKGINGDEVLRGYIMNLKPVKYSGVNETVFEAHNSAVGADRLLKDERALQEEANNYIESVVEKLNKAGLNEGVIGAVSQMYSQNPKLVIGTIQRKAVLEIERFNQIGREDLVKYAIGRFNSLEDKDKPAETYELAKAVAAGK